MPVLDNIYIISIITLARIFNFILATVPADSGFVHLKKEKR